MFDNIGSETGLDLFIAHPATDPNIRDAQGTTPLGRAATNRSCSVFEKVCAILGHPKTDPNLFDKQRRTPLFILAIDQFPESGNKKNIMRRLLEHLKISPNVSSSPAQNPLVYGCDRRK